MDGQKGDVRMSKMLHERLRELSDGHELLDQAADMLEPIETLLNGKAVADVGDNSHYLKFKDDGSLGVFLKSDNRESKPFDAAKILFCRIHSLKPYTPKPKYKDGYAWFENKRSGKKFFAIVKDNTIRDYTDRGMCNPDEIELIKYVEGPEDE